MPLVSIIVPCYNEEATVQLLLRALYNQTYPRQEMEVVIADGLSTDGTRREISAFQGDHPDLMVRVVENPRRNIPSALNRAIEAARGEWIIRLDGHSMPRPDYVSGCISALQQGLGDNVGGVWEIRPRGETWQARAIAVAAAHPLGVGDAHYRYTERALVVDTVPFGAFRADLVKKIGMFNENLLTNEDYEFNARIRQAGGKIWLDPGIRSTYLSSPNLIALIRQYWRYGFWKARMLRRYPETLRWRQALPPLYVLSLVVFALLSFWLSLFRWILLFEVVVYLLVLLAVGFGLAWQKKDPGLFLGVPLAIMCMHLTWGSGLLWSLLTSNV